MSIKHLAAETLRYSAETGRSMMGWLNNDDNRKRAQAVCGSTDDQEPHHVPGSENGNVESEPLRDADTSRRGAIEENVGC